jgi:hypothetical protein
MTFGNPGPGGTCIATGRNRRNCLVAAYLAGVNLVRNRNSRANTETAPNRRVIFLLRENGLNDLRNRGEDLFEAALNWAYSGTDDGSGGGTTPAPSTASPTPATGVAPY